MITVKHAVANSLEYIRDLFPNSVGPRLEEVEYQNDMGGGAWHVTVSFLHPIEPEISGLPQEITGRTHERVYKEVLVDPDTGECLAVRIRELQ